MTGRFRLNNGQPALPRADYLPILINIIQDRNRYYRRLAVRGLGLGFSMETRLKHKDLAAVIAGLRELQGFDAGTNLVQRMLKITGDLVPCEMVTYGKWLTGGNDQPWNFRFLQRPASASFRDHLPALLAHIDEHPLFEPMLQQVERPLKISDLVAPRKFFRTGIYNEFYRRVGIQHQMICVLPKLPDARVVLMLNRRGRDFSERDRQVLSVLVPHFRQAHNHAWAQASISHRRQGPESGFASSEPELIEVGADLKVCQISARAIRWLQNYFPGDCNGATLPETLAAGMRCQSWNQTTGEDLLLPPQTMLVKNETGLLEVTCRSHSDGSANLLLMETLHDPSAAVAQGASLTQREREVYRWMCEGKTYPETAIILGMKPRTVHKHVERIFRKLGVENRLQAERLGWKIKLP